MTHKEFEKVFNDMVEQSRSVLLTKAVEYASDADRLINFKQAAHLAQETQAKALAGMMIKHTVSIYDMLSRYEKGAQFSKEKWDEKILDNFNYLILLQAILEEERSTSSVRQQAIDNIVTCKKPNLNFLCCQYCNYFCADLEERAYCANRKSTFYNQNRDNADSCISVVETEE